MMKATLTLSAMLTALAMTHAAAPRPSTWPQEHAAERFADSFATWMQHKKVKVTDQDTQAARHLHPILLTASADDHFVRFGFWRMVRDPSPSDLEWEAAERLIRAGKIGSIKQTHSLRVYLVTWSGESYVTREPKIDQVWHLVKEIDPSGVFINFGTE